MQHLILFLLNQTRRGHLTLKVALHFDKYDALPTGKKKRKKKKAAN